METFKKKYGESRVSLSSRSQETYNRLEYLVLSYNQNLREEVIRAKDKYNLKIRTVIGDKTGLSLVNRYKEIKHEPEIKEKLNIPIRIADRVPDSLLSILDKFDIPLVDLLLHYRKIKSSIQELKYQSESYSTIKNYHKEVADKENLNASIKHLDLLAKEIENSDILKEIKRLGPDVLGSYFLNDNHIEIYWLSIGLCSILYDIPVEYFTLIVLMHELIHGYTHIGFDKDGNTWDTEAFDNADLKIIEGFAEYYTELICNDYFDFAMQPFFSLQEDSGEEYVIYKQWFNSDEKDKYEKIRRLLLTCRMKKITEYASFRKELRKIK